MLSSILQDLRYGARTLLRTPGFTAVALIAIALGIGANTAMFTIVNGVLLRPLPFPEPERLISLHERCLPLGFPQFSFSPANFIDYSTQNHTFSDITVLRRSSMNYTGSGNPERIPGVLVSPSFFRVLGWSPALGRTFTEQEAKPGSSQVVILSNALWQSRFGSNPNILNQSVRLDDKPYTIIGVMPAGFEFPSKAQLWMPAAWDAKESAQRGGHYLGAVGRLKPGVSVEQAQADLNMVAKRLQKQYPESNSGWDTVIRPVHEEVVSQVRPAMMTLLAAVGFVLLIACANLANLLLSRSAAREREISIRAALGAGKRRIIQQLITESFLLSLLGGAIGLAIGYAAITAFLRATPDVIPRAKDIGLDWHVVAFTVAAALITGLLFGIAPALHMVRFDLNSGLRAGGRGSSVGFRRNRLRSVFVMAEVALSMVLLAGAGLLMRSFYQLNSVDPGFSAGGVLTLHPNLSDTRYGDEKKFAAFYEDLLRRLRAVPGVQAVGGTSSFPLLEGNNYLAFVVPSHPPKPVGQEDSAIFYGVTPGYLETMHIPLKSGRYFEEKDRLGAPAVVIISESMAKQFFPNEDPIGKALGIGGRGAKPSTIIGIVGDVHDEGLDAKIRPTMYSSAEQLTLGDLVIAIRTTQDPASLLAPVREVVHQIDPEMPIDKVNTAEDVVIKSLSHPRLAMQLMSVFAGLALLLATIGIYGVMSYTVTQATQEIGVRVALGAQAMHVMGLVLGYGGILTAVGVAVGVPAALVLTRLLRAQLYDVKPQDPFTYTVVAVVLAVVALAACAIPALRAMRVDPNVALRYE